ncbi:AAA family ATPase [Candidatus Woesearchaeota archaeon CG10_big_fil_rev_8_21_14_0_10_37_12]|nr:MAG: AAA family ATPase [Candidatus Woesearchaeota archaeon CG10_big_fil_rev_8_21_14_0_10_37_12]
MKLEDIKKTFDFLFAESGKVIVGQNAMMKQIVVAMLADSHALLEGYPGVAKTLAVRTMSELLDLKFSRIQHTPDLMPSDITGTYIIEETSAGKRNFKFQPGPIFANIVLADEINRATPKTQSALLEAMQEKQVTVGTNTFKLDEPFFVLATQNPIEQEGTYQLPEAQADRFLLKIKVDYPTFDEELEIVNRFTEAKKDVKLKKVLNTDALLYLQNMTKQIPIANDIKKYAVEVVTSSRKKSDLIEYGASPRASLGLVLASKAKALIEGRKYVSKADINEMALPILRHRIILSFEAERQGLHMDDVIKKLLR